MVAEIKHNSLHFSDDSVVKDFSSKKGLIYAATAHAFSNVVQYPVFGERFFAWPLAFRAKVRAEREWIYQEAVHGAIEQRGGIIAGVPFTVVPFRSLEGSSIKMDRLDNRVSVYELLKSPDTISDRDKLAHSIGAYGVWTGILCNRGVVPECNHCGNIMVDKEANSSVALIDFENYSGSIRGLNVVPAHNQKFRHRLTDKSVDPITSLALDVGIIAGLKLPQQEKNFYLASFISGFSSEYNEVNKGMAPHERLKGLLSDRRVKALGLTRGIFYDATHHRELAEGPSAVAYFKRDYNALREVADMSFA